MVWFTRALMGDLGPGHAAVELRRNDSSGQSSACRGCARRVDGHHAPRWPRHRHAGDEPEIRAEVVEKADLEPVINAGPIAVPGEEGEGRRRKFAPDGVPVIQDPEGLHLVGHGKGMGVRGELAQGVGHEDAVDGVAADESRKEVGEVRKRGYQVGRGPPPAVPAGADGDVVKNNSAVGENPSDGGKKGVRRVDDGQAEQPELDSFLTQGGILVPTQMAPSPAAVYLRKSRLFIKSSSKLRNDFRWIASETPHSSTHLPPVKTAPFHDHLAFKKCTPGTKPGHSRFRERGERSGIC